MAGRVSLGAAEYTISIDTQPFVRGMAEAEAKGTAAAKRIAAAITDGQQQINASLGKIKAESATIPVKLDTRAIDQNIKQVQARLGGIKDESVGVKLDTRPVDASIRAVQAKLAGIKDETVEVKVRTQQAPGGSASGGLNLGAGLRAGLAAGAGFAGVTLGAQAVGQAYEAVIDATLKAEQAQKALNVVYGESAVLYQGIARSAAASSTATLTSTQQVVTQFNTLRANYGFTADQIERLTKLTLDYAAVTGKDVVDVSQRLAAALRGEAEAAEQLGLTLNSDAVKGMAQMTAEQRKNFETLDQVTKAQIIYNELLRQSANVQGSAAKNTDNLQGSQAALAKEGANLAEAIGTALTPSVIGFNQAAAGAAKATAEWITRLGELERARKLALPASESEFGIGGVPGTGSNLIPTQPGRLLPQAENDTERREQEAQRAAVAAVTERVKRTNAIEEAAAKQKLQRDIKYAEEGVKIREELTRNFIDQAREEAAAQQQVIEDTRDRDIEAVQAAADAEIAALDARQQAASDYYASAIAGVEAQRDADLAAIEARKDAALRGLEAERRGVEEARRTEGRGIEDRRARERSAIEASTAAGERYFAAERQGIEANRDAALRALDDRSAAEDRRHSEAMRNLDREEQAQLGIIDEALDALDAQEEAERRGETDRQHRQARADAQRDVREADTPAERSAARRRLADVDRDIQREQRRRQRDDARAALRDRAEAIRAEFDQKKQAEQDKHAQAQEAIEKEKQRIQEQANIQLQALNDNLKIFQENQQLLLQALDERYKEEDRKREDARRQEDQSFADRRQAIEDQADTEARAVRGAADARITELRKQAQASDRYYADEKRKVRAWADDQIREIRRVSSALIVALNHRLQQTVRALTLELKRHQEAADRMVAIWRRALQDVRGHIRAEITITSSSGSGSTSTGGGAGSGGGSAGRPGWFNPYNGQVVYQEREPEPAWAWERLPASGGGGRGQPIQSRDIGGLIERDRLYRVHQDEVIAPSRNAYVVSLAEQRRLAASMPEPSLLSAGVASGAQRGWDGAAAGPSVSRASTVNFSPTINVDARGVPGAEGVSDLVVAKTAQMVVRLIDRTERLHAEAVDRTLGGAI
jgi:hypothetical protein